jgi:hypothetical protein
MFEQVQRQHQQPVAVVASHGAADLLVATLRVNGIEATATMASVYPSLDWVEGVAVTVADADAELARELLRDLGHDPVAPRDDPGADR